MAYQQALQVVCHLEGEPVNVGEGPIVAGDFAHHESAHAAEARQVEALWLVEDKIRYPVGKAAGEVAPNRVPFLIIIGVDDLLARLLVESQQTRDLLWRVLQVVVHRDDMRSAGLSQSRHYRIMFAIVAGQVDQRDWNVRLVNERAAYVEAVVSAAVVDEHELVSARVMEGFERANPFGNAT